MAKLESNFRNMLVSLTLVSAGMAVVLAGVFLGTRDAIARTEKAKTENAIKQVIPPFDTLKLQKMPDEDGDTVYVYYGYKADSLVGIAVETFTTKGFAGKLRYVIGFLKNGNIQNMAGFDIRETPGLGSKMKDPAFLKQFIGKNPSTFVLKVKKDGGQVDAITGATISSRAFCDAAQKAYNATRKDQKK